MVLVIGASRSDPHTDDVDRDFPVYMYPYKFHSWDTLPLIEHVYSKRRCGDCNSLANSEISGHAYNELYLRTRVLVLGLLGDLGLMSFIPARGMDQNHKF